MVGKTSVSLSQGAYGPCSNVLQRSELPKSVNFSVCESTQTVHELLHTLSNLLPKPPALEVKSVIKQRNKIN